jgi:UDP-3-O-[3-hydroxymyristoyl] glucosamine N-acyltransferase
VSKNCKPPTEPYVIGEGCDIHPTAVIYPNVVIGDRVTIKANAVIGGDGFGFINKGSGMKIPNFGRVVIGNGVYIGSCTCIDRGTLGDTVIEDDVKIDNLVHIAHNVVLRRGAVVIANAMVAGSVDVGAMAWVAPSASIRNGISIGNGAVVGLGAVVASSVEPGVTVLGNPAVSMDEFRETRKKIKAL